MTIFARSRSWLAGALSRHPQIGRVAVPFAAILAVLALCAAPAGAVVVEVEGTNVGLQKRDAPVPAKEIVEPGPHLPGEGNAGTFFNEAGNAVLHGTSIYLVYWDPEVRFHPEWVTKINRFAQDMGATSGGLSTIFSANGQYRDRTNTGAAFQTVFKGNYSDTIKYPPAGCTDPQPLKVGAVTCLTDAQIRAHLQSFIAARGLPTGMGTIYYLLTPPGVTVCLTAAATHCSDFKASGSEITKKEHLSASYENSFCSYHGDINPDAVPQGDTKTVLYGAIPWTAGYQGMAGVQPATPYYGQGYPCQDGGWNPEGNEENFEQPKPMSEDEEKILKGEKGSPHEKAALERHRELEEPHIESPNQEGKGEFGDYAPGLADLIINQIAVEQANTTTDPMLNAWQDSTHHEVTDICHDVFASTSGRGILGSVTADEHTEAGTLSNESFGPESGATNYYINNTFSLSGSRCVGGVGMVPRFTVPNPVNTGEIVGVNGMESSVLLSEGWSFGPTGPPTKTYMTFSWNFGDGTPETKGFAPGAPTCEAPWLSPCAASAFHAYTYGGTYNVTLTVVDVAGNTARQTHVLTVNGPPPPAPPPAPGSSPTGGSAGSGAGSSGGSKGSGSKAGTLSLAASAAIVSHSLKSVVRKGLAVRYTVNQQVAGHFEVLLSKSLARRLKIGGPAASGLPAGTAPELVIGKAVLVTTKAGNGAMTIKLPSSIAARLGKAHSATLFLRMVVRNSASAGGDVATVLSSAQLG